MSDDFVLWKVYEAERIGGLIAMVDTVEITRVNIRDSLSVDVSV